LIAVGTPKDEYDPEVSTILPRLREAASARDLQRIVHEEFVHWFSAEIAGPSEIYATVSEVIWPTWQVSAVGPNKERSDGHNGGIR